MCTNTDKLRNNQAHACIIQYTRGYSGHSFNFVCIMHKQTHGVEGRMFVGALMVRQVYR